MKHFAVVLALAAGLSSVARASINYTVSGEFTFVNGVGQPANTETFTDSSGDFTLTYGIAPSAATNFVTTFPSGENYGFFTVACPGCTAGLNSGTFPQFTIVLTLTDTDTGGVGQFVGTSAGSGAVTVNTTANTGSVDLTVNWTPVQLGPDTSNLNSGSFGLNFFTISTPSILVDPTNNSGQTTIQGQVFENPPAGTPEPASLALVGLGLVGVGFVTRRKSA